MKKLALFTLILLLITVVLVSCGDDGYKTPEKNAKEMIENIVVCFENNDAETLKSYFKENVHVTDSEITEAFEFIDGEIVSIDEPEASATGPTNDKSFGANINITTDKGTVYNIDFNGKYRYDEDKRNEGVKGIRVVNKTLDSKAEGENEKDECRKCIGDYWG